MIHVCFSLHDKTGSYSKFTGTAMLSLFENLNNNTPPNLLSITVHLLHDNTLTDDNRDKFTQIADRYGQQLKFYNVEELCADKLAEINGYFSNITEYRFSIAMFYRLLIPHILPQEIEKVIYLDSDIIVNLDISELWQIELGDNPLGAVPNLFQIKDEVASNERTKTVIMSVKEGIIKPENYFNSGVLLMNLKVLRNEEGTILAGIKFRSEHPQLRYFDQEILNYCFSTSYLKLPVKFNRYVLLARRENEMAIEKKIYHYAANRYSLGMDTNDPYNRLFGDYFIKIPWVDADTKVALSGISLPSRKNYTVSVVIPMYNAAEYIAECLDSLVIQTFQDFEVIVVDDCSTDESVAIVESYSSKFNGRLRLIHTEKNSGGGGYVPRNMGIMLARGEYIQFLDADDMLLGNALKILYMAANFYDTDVLYTNAYYNLTAPNDVFLKRDDTKVDGKINLTIDDLNENLNRLFPKSGAGDFHTPWTRFCRRDFLLENALFFPKVSCSGDFLWVINLYCHARRFLRISTPLCLHRRYNDNSITRRVRTPQEQCLYWFQGFVDFAKVLHELEKNNEVLSENLSYGLTALKKHLIWCLNRTKDARSEIDSEEIYNVLHDKFAKISDDLVTVLSFLFRSIDKEKKVNANYAESINKFSPFITARIDIRLISTEGNFQILSVSNKNTDIMKPASFQKNGSIGYIIQSYAGELEFVVKTTVAGKINLSLRGKNVPSLEDKSKRIPYWIDYTKLIVNEETIFDEITPAWHDKPYRYKMYMKAEEEIKIRVEWLPHRSDTVDESKVMPPPPPIVETPPPPIVETPPPPVVETPPPLQFETARIDVKMLTRAMGDFQILSVSDDKANITKPSVLQDNGVGYMLTSSAGNLMFVAKATADGQINLKLRGMDIRDPKNKSKRIPKWIIYTKLIVNDKTIFDELTPTWHDKPYVYKVDVKAEEEIKIRVEWQPRKSEY